MKTTLTKLFATIAKDKGIDDIGSWVKKILSTACAIYTSSTRSLTFFSDAEHYIFGVKDAEFDNLPFVMFRETEEKTEDGKKYEDFTVKNSNFLQGKGVRLELGQCVEYTSLDIKDFRVYFNEEPLNVKIWVEDFDDPTIIKQVAFNEWFEPEEVVGVTADIYTLFLNDERLVSRIVEKRGYEFTAWEAHSELLYGFNPVRKAYYALYSKDEDALLSQMVELFEDIFTEKDEGKSGDLTAFLTTPLLRVTYEEKVFKPYIVRSQGQIIDMFLEEE